MEVIVKWLTDGFPLGTGSDIPFNTQWNHSEIFPADACDQQCKMKGFRSEVTFSVKCHIINILKGINLLSNLNVAMEILWSQIWKAKVFAQNAFCYFFLLLTVKYSWKPHDNPFKDSIDKRNALAPAYNQVKSSQPHTWVQVPNLWVAQCNIYPNIPEISNEMVQGQRRISPFYILCLDRFNTRKIDGIVIMI